MSWALVMFEAQLKEIQSNKVKAFMNALKLNGLITVYPPKGVIRHTFVELQYVPIKYIFHQVLERTVSVETVTHNLRG